MDGWLATPSTVVARLHSASRGSIAGLRERDAESWRLSAVARVSTRLFLGSGKLGSWSLGVGPEERLVQGTGPKLAATISFEGLAR